MLFSSMTFIGMFLPIVLLLYLITKKELHNPILLISSILFYAWGEPKYLAIMLLSIIINYFGALAIDKFQKYKKISLTLTIIGNLSFLIYFKYFNFLIDNCNNIFHANIEPLNIIMPIGISFYTFQALSYVIDVYRKDVKAQKDIYKLALYICLFPQLIAGPIVKYHDIAEQIDSREVNFEKVSYGVKRFIIGLSKKILIANTMGAIADKIFCQDPHTIQHSIAWLGSIAYSFQLFFDFSGYSDMAIGLGMIFGFRFMENFNYPYISKSITEFWRRWHISLSTWFKEYIYISLGGNRCSKLKTLRNLGIVFLVTGIWHGASWNFVIWGLWHGAFIILEKIFNIKQLQETQTQIWQKTLWHIYCIFIFLIGWVMFRADNMKHAWDYLMNMFGLLHLKTDEFLFGFSYYIDRIEIITFMAAIVCSVPLFKNILKIKTKWKMALINAWLTLLLILSMSSIAANTYNPFIYFRF
ncbi:MAG: MBOAT family protein [Cyanobacteria bacterium SIG27]|nr:MBOAT family protein [Cyanobacteria bacterium SIG27]